MDAPSGYRNGYGKPRKLSFTSGTIEVKRPRVRGLEERFESAILPLFARRTQEVGQLLPELYLHGLSQGDFEKAVLEQLSAVFRTPTLVSRTYFAAKGMEEAGRERLLTRKERLEDDLLKVRERALEEGTLDGHGSDPGPTLVELNREAATLSRS